MNRRTRTLLLMMGMIVVLTVMILMRIPKRASNTGSIAMLNIGQGDSFLISAPSGAQLLIDGGRDATVLSELAKAMPTGDHSIDVVIATHPDADHIGGLPLVVGRYKVGLFLTSQVASSTDTYKSLMQELKDHGVPSYIAQSGETITLDPTTTFKILFPDREVANWETNTASVVGRLDMGARSVLFTGDSPASIEHYLVQTRPNDINVDMLKLGHHGSKTSSSEAFLRATSPVLALISAGVRNSYGHPAPEVLSRLTEARIPWVSTQDHGRVIFTTNGTTLVKSTER